MSSAEALTAITICFYLCASVAGICGFVWRKAQLRRFGCWLSLASFICQTLILVFGFHRLLPSGLSFGAYLQLLAWFSLLAGVCAWLRLRQDAILLFAAPLGLILFLMSSPWLATPIRLPASLSAPFYALHIGALFLGLGLLALAFLAGIAFLIMQGRLKARKNLSGVWEDMPALALLDKINAVCAIFAFPLYTIGLVAGLFWARPVFGASFSGDTKEIISVFVWALLGLLFYNRISGGWAGRKPAMLACAIFLLSLFSILVINLFFPTHHGVLRG